MNKNNNPSPLDPHRYLAATCRRCGASVMPAYPPTCEPPPESDGHSSLLCDDCEAQDHAAEEREREKGELALSQIERDGWQAWLASEQYPSNEDRPL